MRYYRKYKKKPFPVFRYIFLFIGINGMIFFLTFDFFRASESKFGSDQLAGFVVSTIIAVAGLRKVGLLRARAWDGLLLLVYLSGILFMGLRSYNDDYFRFSGMLQSQKFFFSDATINFLGFVPLGYLMMSYLLPDNLIRKKIPVSCFAIAACVGISLLIELSQYYMPSRDSSLFDLLCNGLGAVGGIIYYHLEQLNFRSM